MQSRIRHTQKSPVEPRAKYGTHMNYEKQVNNLMDDAHELVSKLRDNKNPEVQRLCDRVETFLAKSDDHGASGHGHRPVKIRRIPGSLLDYVRNHPWLAVVTAASLAWTLGHLSSEIRESR
jgi:ElaB/YqjD/DUF883 family membrane-anchored ribosome-binding protein